MRERRITLLAGAALNALADHTDTPEEITEVLAEMCRIHETVMGGFDKCLEK